MVDLTPTPGPLVTTQQPRSNVTPAQIAQPYSEYADALNKSGEALQKASGASEDLAENTAKQAGYRAVTRDDQGNLQIQKMPIIGPASAEYSRAVKFAALADGEAKLRQDDIRMRAQYHDNPEGYLAAADSYKKTIVDEYGKAGGADLGITLGRSIDATTTQTYRGLLTESERLALERSNKSLSAGISSAKDDAMALARGGAAPDTPAMLSALDKVHTLTNEKVNNPRLAYPKEAADYDTEQFYGELKGQTFLHNVDQTYQNAPTKAEGAAAALEQAKTILSDPSTKLTMPQRQQYYSKAVGEIHANEAIRRQDVAEARAAGSALRMTAAYGGKIAPEDVESVAQAFRAAGAPGEVARLYAWASRAPLGDDFGRQPLDEQTRQLNELRGSPRQKAAYDFFRAKGYSDEQAAGIVGGLRGETEALNTTQLHDGGIGIGIAGWNAERRAALGTFAKANGKSPLDLQTQLEFVDHELRTNEGAAGDQLRAAKTPEDAAKAMLNYLRPAGFDQPGAHPERARYARMAFNAFGANPSDASLGDVAGNPAGAMWLQANRSRTIGTEAGQAWSRMMKDYAEKGIRPNDDALNKVVAAARATNNHDLLETIASGVDTMDFAQAQAQKPLAEQQAGIATLQAAANTGGLSIGQAGVMKDLQNRYNAITKGLAENPISTTLANFGDRFKVPPPLNVQDPAQLAAGLGMRGKIAQFAQQNWGGPARQALDKADLAAVTAALDTPDPAVKGQIFAAITAALPEDVRNATLHKIGEKRPDFMVSAAAGGLMQQAPDVAQSILRGQAAIKAEKQYWPTAGTEKQAAQDELDKQMPATTFSLAGRTDDSGPFAVAHGMIRARYADLSAQSGDTSGKLNKDRLAQATTDVTGGVLYHNGAPLIAPARGMSQSLFDGVLRGVTDQDVAGVTTLGGEPVTPEYVKSTAQLESVGDGRYTLRLGKDPMRPIYAYQGIGTEAGGYGGAQKFVLDLRGRQPVAPKYDMAPVTAN